MLPFKFDKLKESFQIEGKKTKMRYPNLSKKIISR